MASKCPLEDLVSTKYFAPYRDRRILVTGHTGFKGTWLSLWLKRLGARVAGFALPPEDGADSFFVATRAADGMDSIIGNLRDPGVLNDAFARVRPEIVFHLAAQSLVRRSYEQPVETYATNVMGTVHLLDAASRSPGLKAVVVVTSDKCYDNLERPQGYVEADAMGGADPYSSSKGCTELVTEAYRRSFFGGDESALVASARAGNVIGGGDWGQDRLLPDIAKAIGQNRTAVIRNPNAVRPWQHVLEPLRGYMMLGARLLNAEREFAEGWNFGPDEGDALSVGEIADKVVRIWGRGELEYQPQENALHEAGLLMLNIDKSRARLGYRPALGIDAALRLSVDWYHAYFEQPQRALDLCLGQIDDYMDSLA